jgi:hypothetical protein
VLSDLPDRFWAKVDKTDTCWLWTGFLNENGYGRLLGPAGTLGYAHRLAYADVNGDVPKGLILDHVCHNADRGCPGGSECMHRRCVRPDHLEAVTPMQNAHRSHCTTATRTHCAQGHPFSGANLFVDVRGRRRCRTCHRLNNIRQRVRRAVHPSAEDVAWVEARWPGYLSRGSASEA